MAVEILIGVVAQSLLDKALSLAAEDLSLVWSIKDNLESIASELETIQALVVDTDRKNNFHSNTMQLWLKTLQNLASDSDDILEEYRYHVLGRRVRKAHKKWHKVCGFFPSISMLVFRLKMVPKIKSISSHLKRVKEQGIGYGLNPSEFRDRSSDSEIKLDRMTSPSVQEKKIVGRDKDVTKVVEMLVNAKNEEYFAIIAIKGMGGQGKTAVAQLVYKNDNVVKHFEHRIWVCVSEDFKVERVLNEMVESITRTNSNLTNREALINKLQETLGGKRYLLVLDDVWNEDQEKWEHMENDLREIGGSRGTKVLITTRNDKAVSTMRASYTHHLGKLSDKDGWTLFKEKAFAEGGVMETSEFVNIGQKIVKRCEGVPLAIKALGGLLYSKKSVGEWLNIDNSDIWSSSLYPEGVLASINLSYNNLPSLSVKQCFAYCSLFPKDASIDREKLIQLWMAQGFLNPPNGSSLQMEDVGSYYFDILLWNSLLQEPAYDDYNNIQFCKMHNLVHDFASHVSKDYCFTMKVGQNYNDVKATHLSIMNSIDVPQGISPKLRTLYLRRGIIGDKLISFRCLRTLILCNQRIEQLPTSIGRLKYLRCMDIERTGVRILPSSCKKLYNLQTLRVCPQHSSKIFVGTLIELRHIYLRYSVQCMLIGIRQLVHLQTLPYFTVSDEDGCKIEELGTLNDLRGKLIIYGLDKVKSGEAAEKANLSVKSKVGHLELHWPRQRKELRDEEVLEGLRPHSHLTCLKIVNFKGSRFPSWMTTSNAAMLRSLMEFTLEGCDSWERLPTEGPFLSLRSLSIVACEKFSALPRGLKLCTSLETIEIYNCPALLGVDGYGLEHLPSLKTMKIGEFSEELNYFPWPQAVSKKMATAAVNSDHFASLQNLTLWGWSKLTSLPEQLQHLPVLTSLSIRNFKGLETLPEWLGNIQSLEDLNLTNCENLKYMPSVEAMQRLTNLRILRITNCGLLAQRCRRGSGEEWHKVVNIPRILVDSVDINTNFQLASQGEHQTRGAWLRLPDTIWN